jgi:hypothetical protein
MEKQEFIAVVTISLAMVAVCKNIQKTNPISHELPLEVSKVEPQDLPVQKEILAVAKKKSVTHVDQKDELAALDLGVDIEAPLPKLDISLHAPQPVSRRFKLYDLSMMLTSQVLIEPYVEKFTISAPLFYIDAKSDDNSSPIDVQGRKVLFL